MLTSPPYYKENWFRQPRALFSNMHIVISNLPNVQIYRRFSKVCGELLNIWLCYHKAKKESAFKYELRGFVQSFGI
ncbi:hypothetical protein Desmer_1895 [Desulfosporosinus meridiei DSM 13257]|uniref:Uncharacterized protein n=1 Tax=Desulfosporosinus meridiei (strain ATCC BAA-275 / DSM 13257 / KCTC 12902 / NCIMB 13706 / S10) TaxID=768704 RepID=J7IYU0_DESMD|nr:hypothetical protein Desmer_1895 [Desulfosporosinus meridiei DSM 13257]